MIFLCRVSSALITTEGATRAKSIKTRSYASVASSVPSSTPDPVAIAVHVKAIEEDRINQLRQKCLLIHNIPEQNSDTATEKFDSTIANDLAISASIKRNSVKVFRIGRKISDRPRPLKIEADSLETSKALVRYFRKFRNTREDLKNCKARLDYSEPILEMYRNLWKTVLERNAKEGVMSWIVGRSKARRDQTKSTAIRNPSRNIQRQSEVGSNVKCALLNCQSIRNKTDLLKFFAFQNYLK
ncbi:unnamed protein product [Anisakis simplex]|uniref:Uncharacterized protein n=1 Tax=Anisakis simplex TaxID=6269 RepID=A0A0M3JZ40_ANISI|nr:unnamed protein product [Anisakis simplex]